MGSDMQNLYVYLWVFFAVKLGVVVIFALMLFKGPLRLKRKRLLLPMRPAHERFFCVKSNLKRMNEDFYVAQMVFTHKRDGTLTAHSDTQRHTPEEQN